MQPAAGARPAWPDRRRAVAAHLSPLLAAGVPGFVVAALEDAGVRIVVWPGTFLVISLFIWGPIAAFRRWGDDDGFLGDHAAASVNFHLTAVAAAVVAVVGAAVVAFALHQAPDPYYNAVAAPYVTVLLIPWVWTGFVARAVLRALRGKLRPYPLVYGFLGPDAGPDA